MYRPKNHPQINIDGVEPTAEEREILHAIIGHWYGLVGEAEPDANGDDGPDPANTFNDATLLRLTAYHRKFGSKVITDLMDRAVERKGPSVEIGYVMTSLANHLARPRYSTSLLAQIQRESGRKGGLSTSDAKAAAAKVNGAKGGRPRKVEPTPVPVNEVEDEDVKRFDDDAPRYVPAAVTPVADDDPDLARFAEEPAAPPLSPVTTRYVDGREEFTYECRQCGRVHTTTDLLVKLARGCPRTTAAA